MIKFKAKYNEKNDNFNINYSVNGSNTLEHIATIWVLVDKILENDKNISEDEIIEMIKRRKQFRNYNMMEGGN